MGALDAFKKQSSQTPEQEGGALASLSRGGSLAKFKTGAEVEPVAQTPLPEPGELDVGATFGRGVDLLKANFASAFGQHEDADKIIAQMSQASMPNFRQIEGVGDTAQFIAERTLESAPNTGLSLLGGGLGFLVGGGPIGAMAGAALFSGVPMLGESRREIREEGGEGGVLEAALPASANTALELLPTFKIAKIMGVSRVLRKHADEVIKESAEEISTIKKAINKARETGELTVQEGLVETAQELNNKLAGRFFADKEVLALADEDFEQLKQAFAGGLAGGLGSGVVASGVGSGVDVVVDRAKKKKAAKLKASVAGQLAELIKEKKQQIEAGEQIIDEAAEGSTVSDLTIEGRFDSADIFNVFGEGSDLPGSRGRGPLTGIHGQHKMVNVDGEQIQTQGQKGVKLGDVTVPWADLKEKGGAYLLEGHDGGTQTVTFPEGGQLDEVESRQAMRDFVQEILTRLGLADEINIVLGNMNQTSAIWDNKTDQRYSGNANGHQFSMETLGNVVGIDFAGLANQHDTREAALARIAEVTAHEVGHAVISQKWRTMNNETKRGLLQGYRDWLNDVEGMSFNEFSEKYDAPTMSRSRMGKYPQKTKDMPMGDLIKGINPQDADYLLRFDEYAAQMFAKAVTGNIDALKVNKETKSFLKEVRDTLKKVWQGLRDRFKGTPTFEAWVNNMFLREEVRQMEEVLVEMQNPTGERKSTISRVKDFIMGETEPGVQTAPNYEAMTPNMMGDILDKLGMENQAADMRHHQDVMLGFMRLSAVLTPLQLAELARKSGIREADSYMRLVREYSNTKMKQVVIADEVLQKWKALGDERTTKLGNFLFEVSTRSDELKRRLKTEEVEAMAKAKGLDAETFAVWQRVDESFREVLRNTERGLVLDAAQSFINDPTKAAEFRDAWMDAVGDGMTQISLLEQATGLDLLELVDDEGKPKGLYAELLAIEKQIKALRNRNYFPRTRLGQYTITVKATEDGQVWEEHSGKRGATLGFYSFETKRERDAMLKALTPDAKDAGVAISGSVMDTEVFAMTGMPEVLIRQIMSDPKLNLNDEQKEQLKNVSLNLSPGKKFLRQLKKRRGIVGFSDDAIRVYSTYMMSAANHLARVEHAKSMVKDLQAFKDKIKELELTNVGGQIDDLVKLKDYYSRHFDYLMKPDNDWANLRSMGFLWYLGANVKSALVNLTQIPLVTFPVMAGRFGDRKASGALASAYRDIPKTIRSGKKLADDEEAMLQTLRDTGILDESMVMELAGMGEADILKRTIPGWDFENVLTKMSYYGGAMFRMGEKFNRNVTALAAYRLGKKEGVADPVAYAREVVEKSQFEYAKWNRAEFMRGKKSVLFLFWQYMQHASFLFFGGEGKQTATRMWLLALFVSGVEGLPFAKTLFEGINLFGTEAAEAMGVDNPKVHLESDMRELLLEITDKPDLVLKGMASYYGLGPLHLLSLVGAPVPNVDVSGSLGFGSPVPFLSEALKGSGSPDEELGKLTASILGPVGGIGLQLWKSASSVDPNTWKNVERAMPVFAKNAMQGARWLDDGKETFRGGGEFLNMDKPEHRVSAVMKALGFQPTRLTQKYNQVTTQQEVAVYWTLRKQLLLSDYAYAKKIGDRESMKDVMDGIKDHNKAMRKQKELRGLSISGKDMKNSLRAKARAVRLRELGRAPSERQELLFRDIARLFPVEK